MSDLRQRIEADAKRIEDLTGMPAKDAINALLSVLDHDTQTAYWIATHPEAADEIASTGGEG